MLGFPTLLSDLFVGVRDCLVGFAGDHGRYCSGNLWCRGWESNPEGPEARGILSPLRLPFPPPRHRAAGHEGIVSTMEDRVNYTAIDMRAPCPEVLTEKSRGFTVRIFGMDVSSRRNV